MGSDFRVVASCGHIRELTTSDRKHWLGIDVENGFQPIFETIHGKEKIISSLKKNVEEADDVYLATDPDREGEAISWHLCEVLGLDVKTTKRLEFHEITYSAIHNALSQPRTIDMQLVSSQETRRILDRIIGFELTKLLKGKIGSKSAGRVQSAVLKIIVDKQKEIDEFVEQKYYLIDGQVKIKKKVLDFKLLDAENKELHFETLAEANKVIKTLNNNKIVIQSIIKQEKTRASKPIYTTSTMQQDASLFFKFNSKKTMKIAQQLYEGIDLGDGPVGLITYMRTDSVRANPAFIKKSKDEIAKTYGEDYVGTAKIFNRSSDNVQDAHEGIHPTDISITPEIVASHTDKDSAKLYEMIYRRSLASMMKDEVYEHVEISLTCDKYNLLISGDERLFNGFVAALDKFDKVERNAIEQGITENDEVTLSKASPKESKTKGPQPYSEASLIHTMEKDGIGRPSTYAQTLDTIQERLYVKVSRSIYSPTPQGIMTTKSLDEYFSDIINVGYTASMETTLDKIAQGNANKIETLNDFCKLFYPLLAKAMKEMPKEEPILEDLGNCPNCGRKLITKKSKFGQFIACSGYPECKYIYKDEKEGQVCPLCKKGFLKVKMSAYGKFYACSNFPRCKYHESIK